MDRSHQPSRHGNSPVVEGDMDEFDRQLGAELRRIHTQAAPPTTGRVGVTIKQPSATAGVRLGARPGATPGGGSNGNTPAGPMAGTPLGGHSISPSGWNNTYSNTATPSGLPSGGAHHHNSTAQSAPSSPPLGVDPEIATLLAANKGLTRHMKMEIARLVIKQSGLAISGPLTEETATRIVSVLAAELASPAQSGRVAGARPPSGSGFPSAPANSYSKWGNASPPPTSADSGNEGRATIESELLWSTARGVPAGANHERPNAPHEDALIGMSVLYDKCKTTRGGASATNGVIHPTKAPPVGVAGGPIKPRPTIGPVKPHVHINPNIPLMAAQHLHAMRKKAGASTVTRSASSAFSECSTSSYGSLHSSLNQGK